MPPALRNIKGGQDLEYESLLHSAPRIRCPVSCGCTKDSMTSLLPEQHGGVEATPECHEQLVGSRSCSLTPHRRAPCPTGKPTPCCCRDTLPCEIWERIGTLLLPDACGRLWPLAYPKRDNLTRLTRLSLACSNTNSALGPTRKAAKEVLQRIKLRLLSDKPSVSSGYLYTSL